MTRLRVKVCIAGKQNYWEGFNKLWEGFNKLWVGLTNTGRGLTNNRRGKHAGEGFETNMVSLALA
jgi:hypothetical protein